jgi:hypothetical protein
MKYRFEYMTLTQLGEIFGVSSHKVGDWLVEIDFRTENKRPSKMAFEKDVVKEGPSRGQGYNWVWHAEKTITALEVAGHKRVFPAPRDLVDPSPMVAPFAIRTTDEGNFLIENGDGEPILLGQNEESCKLLVRILEVAASCKKIGSVVTL